MKLTCSIKNAALEIAEMTVHSVGDNINGAAGHKAAQVTLSGDKSSGEINFGDVVATAKDAIVVAVIVDVQAANSVTDTGTALEPRTLPPSLMQPTHPHLTHT